jgi:hypothetical protein
MSLIENMIIEDTIVSIHKYEYDANNLCEYIIKEYIFAKR